MSSSSEAASSKSPALGPADSSSAQQGGAGAGGRAFRSFWSAPAADVGRESPSDEYDPTYASKNPVKIVIPKKGKSSTDSQPSSSYAVSEASANPSLAPLYDTATPAGAQSGIMGAGAGGGGGGGSASGGSSSEFGVANETAPLLRAEMVEQGEIPAGATRGYAAINEGGGNVQHESDDYYAKHGRPRWQRPLLCLCCCLFPLLIFFFLYSDFMRHTPVIIPIGGGSGSQIAAICNPFAFPVRPQVDLKHDHGIVFNLKYVNTSVIPTNILTDVNSYETHSTSLNQTFFFSNLNTSTRSYTDNFLDQSGETLIPSSFFYLNGRTRINMKNHLNENAAEVTQFQFALISDDGCVIRIRNIVDDNDVDNKHLSQVSDDSGWNVLIDNDGIHPSRLATSHAPVDFSDKQHQYDLNIKYFQGPPSHIALLLLYRPWPTQGDVKDVDEGIEGNDEWFDWRTNVNATPLPKERFYNLLARGWKVVPEDNFFLPLGQHYDNAICEQAF